ncbi:hypothetical protein F511_47254 [Dorcoceras hygrometricum]|uniref:Uncharacterized protein n=1 Tax=Dorcoceras hygrometricum TaxID=472368 RepID=A0A2Z6ZSJ9_9LAMI|nr:hypothetical protein F511_47254 [Dorcoceras hygrometricum]
MSVAYFVFSKRRCISLDIVAPSFNLVVPPFFKRYQLLRADIGRGFLRRTLLYRIKKFLRSQYKIEVAESVLVVQTGEPVAIQYSSERVFHRNHFIMQ